MMELLLTYKYFFLFPLAIVEGPIITLATGLLVKTGIFNVFVVYAVVVAGDITGDTLTYSLGRFGGPVILNKFSRFFSITPEKREKAREYFDTHHHRTLILSKIVHGVGIAGILTAGNLKIPYPRFVFVCAAISIVQSAVFLVVGVFFGNAYLKIAHYIDFFGKTTIITGIVVGLIIFFYFRLRKV